MRSLPLLLALSALGACTAGARAVDLVKIDRSIRKEPAYKGKPRYCLVTIGPEAKTCVWLVLDGEVLYVDKNGAGDLTQAERVTPRPVRLTGLLRPGEKEPRALRFPCAVTKDVTVELMTIDGRPVQVDVRDAKRKLSLAACGDHRGQLQFSDRPVTAPVIDAGGRLTMYLLLRPVAPAREGSGEPDGPGRHPRPRGGHVRVGQL